MARMKRLVSWKHYRCTVEIQRYVNGRTCLYLVEDGEPIAKITVNVPDPIEWDEVIIKDYGENEGVLDALLDAGIVGRPLGYIKTEFVLFPVCKFYPDKIYEDQ